MAETVTEQQGRERQEALAELEKHNAETESRLGAEEFVVVAPLVNLRVKDVAGAYVIRGYNEGAVVKRENVEPENLRHHVDIRFLAPKGSPDAEFAAPAGTPKPGEPPNVPVGMGTPPEMLPTGERIARNRAAADEAEQAGKRTAGRARQSSSDKQDSSS